MMTLETRLEVASRLRVVVRGAVQGVGFRPFVHRLANQLGLTGWVQNSPHGVLIEVEGARPILEGFLLRLGTEKPPRSFIQGCEASWLDGVGYDRFEIRASEVSGDRTVLVLPDIATCPDCLREISDPTNRRYRYPFTNCTNCGPRFSILAALPYDRTNTSMRSFRMCPACQAEYDDPDDRRFHAQPNACPVCGPQLELWPGNASAPDGEAPRRLAHDHDALLAAAHVIRCGHIVAVKGIGGFHLLVDARNDEAVRRLREKKHREAKPLALMFPTLAGIKDVCEVSPLEERLLCSPEAPIVLLQRANTRLHPGTLPHERESFSPACRETSAVDSSRVEEQLDVTKGCSLSLGERVRVRAVVGQNELVVAGAVAPDNPNLGVMLPSNPLHHLLMAELGFPVVATSGNLSDEPICTDEFEALERLRGIADVFLVHNRPIVRHMDDSIVRVMLDREMVLRRARGFAPFPVTVAAGVSPAVEPGFQPGGNGVEMAKASEVITRTANFCPSPGGKMPPSTTGRMPAATILAVGAHLKNSVALAIGEQVFLSQHIGDLETEPANRAFRRVVADLPRLYEVQPGVIAADLHPDYLSTQFALERQPAARCDANDSQPAGSDAGASPVIRVQHHIAHVLSCLAENEVELPALGVAWDGTGYGTDATIWGGEFFLVAKESVKRIAQLRPFRLPGGDAAAKEPRRAALGLLYELYGADAFGRTNLTSIAAFSAVELAVIKTMLSRGVNVPWCCSVGRLFDVVASLLGLCQQMRFEGQAAMQLEFARDGIEIAECYDWSLAPRHASLVLDWSPMIHAILKDVANGRPVGELAAKFHNTLAEVIVRVAQRSDCPRVALSGGCFQNRYLTERTVMRLRAEGFQPYWHQRVPTNDGGIALGQVVAARRELAKRGAALAPQHRPKNGTLLVPKNALLTTLQRTEARAPLQEVTQHATP